MGKEIIISAEKEQTRIALVEDGELAELYFESAQYERTLGDIYLGRVRKIMPSIQAAFVDIGQKQDAFLHFSDLSDNLPDLLTFLEDPKPEVGKVQLHAEQKPRGKRRRPRHGSKSQAAEQGAAEAAKPHKPDARTRGRRRSAQRRAMRKQEPAAPEGDASPAQPQEERARPDTYLKRGQRILVKIVKEPISSKGSRVSTDISLAGRFLVLVPLADYVAVSKKIVSYKERRRLRTLAKSLAPDGFGVIVRTVAEGKNAKALDTDLRLLLEKWRKIEKKLADHPDPPAVVHVDVNMVSSVIRDLFSEDYDRILVDDHRLYRNIKSYVQAVAPQMVPAVHHHTGPKPVFEATGIAQDVAQAFESRVDLPSGGYLFIERTEAMYVIDVNSGRSGRGMTQEQSSLKVNLEAARVLARQIRLRDIGGIIVVDFIDLRDEKNRQKVYNELKKAFKRDRAVTKILPMSDFGLIQITRQRLRPSITTTFAGPNGTSKEALKAEGPAPSPASSAGRPSGEKEKEKEKKKKKRKKQRASGRKETPDPEPPVAPEVLVQEMERWIAAYRKQGNRHAVILRVHPYTAAYLDRRVPSYPTRWFMKHLVRVRLEPDPKLPPLKYRFVDPRSGEDVTRRVEQPQLEEKGK